MVSRESRQCRWLLWLLFNGHQIVSWTYASPTSWNTTTTTASYIQPNITETEVSKNCSGKDVCQRGNPDLLSTVFLRLTIVVVCIVAFVVMVKMSDVFNRNCSCRRRPSGDDFRRI